MVPYNRVCFFFSLQYKSIGKLCKLSTSLSLSNAFTSIKNTENVGSQHTISKIVQFDVKVCKPNTNRSIHSTGHFQCANTVCNDENVLIGLVRVCQCELIVCEQWRIRERQK